MEFFAWVGKLVWFYLPVGIANMAPVMIKDNFSSLATPIDGGRKLGAHRIFGDHKTWRGFIAGIVFGAIFFAFQKYLAIINPMFNEWSAFDYTNFPWWFGALLGFGALTGDLVKSFFKRRVGIKPGAAWVPFDQLDFVIGATLFIALFVHVDWITWLTVLISAIFLHIAVNRIGYSIGYKDTPW